MRGSESCAGTLGERWQLLRLRGEKSGSASRCGAWSPEAPEGTARRGGGRVGRVALLFWVWFFRDRLGGVNTCWKRDRLSGVNSRKRDRRRREIETRVAGLRFRL